nr:retrotransposon protein, putative, unclassified [Tanacetum cinerariifolium]
MYVNQPDGFVDPYHSDHVYRLKKAFYGLKQAPRAWYNELSNFLVSKGFSKGSIDPTQFITKHREDIWNSDPPILTCIGTPMAMKHLDADLSGTLVDKTKHRTIVGALMYLTARRPDIVHATCYYARYQARPKAEYVSLFACCAQVLWLRTQLIDYGFHFDKIPMYFDSKVAIAISAIQSSILVPSTSMSALPEDRFKYVIRRLSMRCLTPVEMEVMANESA